MPVRSLGWEDPLQKEMVTHSSILAQKTTCTEEPGGYSPWGYKESDRTQQLNNNKKPTKPKIFSQLLSTAAAAAAAIVSVMSNSVQPHKWQPTRLLHPWDSPGKNTRVGCHCLLRASIQEGSISIFDTRLLGLGYCFKHQFSLQIAKPSVNSQSSSWLISSILPSDRTFSRSVCPLTWLPGHPVFWVGPSFLLL